MKNDLEILQQLHEELENTDHPRFADNMIGFYRLLVSRVPEEGFKQWIDDKELSVEQEAAILQLKKYGYLGSSIQSISRDGVQHLVDLRGPRFLELEKSQLKTISSGMQDSGKRETFSTGAVRDSAEGKPRPDLFSPFAMERIGAWLEAGARKYEPRNWEKGMSYERVASSLHRHLMKYMQRDTSEDHLAAICVNASFLMHYDAMIERGVLPKELDDLPIYQPPKAHLNGDEPYDT